MYSRRFKMAKGTWCSINMLGKALIILSVCSMFSIWIFFRKIDQSRNMNAISPYIPNLLQNSSIHQAVTIAQPTRTSNDFAITIAVISNNRLDSLKRLLNSLSNLENPSKIPINLRFSLEASSSKELVQFVYGYKWSYGYKSVMLRVQQGGLIRAVSESWFPASNNDYGLLLEDDIEVSPYAIIWIEKILHKILNAKSYDKARRIIGISLYQPKVTETNEMEFNRRKPFYIREITDELVSIGDRSVPFLFQTPCSWGALYFPDSWKVFLAYLQERISMDNLIRIPYSYTTGWKVSWKKFLYEFMYIKGYFLVYPNFDGAQSFSTNHMESGAHIKSNDTAAETYFFQKMLYTVPLVNDVSILKSIDQMNIDDFPMIDLFGYPFTDRLTLAKTFESYNHANSPGYPYNFLLIKSKNISLYQIIVDEEERQAIAKKQTYIKIAKIFKPCDAEPKNHIISPLLVDPTSITLVIKGVTSINNLFEKIEHYASYPLITTIIVVWCDIDYPLPRHSMIGNSLIYFVCPSLDSVRRSKFKDIMFNDIRISTKAVLIISDNHERKLLHGDITVMYKIFNRFPENIVSLMTSDVSSNEPIGGKIGLRATQTGQKAKYFQITEKSVLKPINLMGAVMINVVSLLNSTCGNFDVVGKIICIGKK